MQKCNFCGSTIIVPSELLHPDRPAFAGDVVGMTGKALKIAEITRLIAGGKKLEAIKLFRTTFGVGLKEAKDAVDAMERGEAVDISKNRVESQTVRTPFKLTIDRGAATSVGKAVGGMIFVIAVSAILFAFAAIAATYFFLRSSTDVVKITTVDGPSKPADGGAEMPDVEELLRIGGDGTGAGRFKDNRSVAVDGEGNIYSADYSGGRIQVFDEGGKFITQWTAEEGMNLYDLAADRQGNVFVLNNKGIRKFAGQSGKLLAKADNHIYRAIATMPDGKVIGTGRVGITVFDNDLKVIRDMKDAHKDANTPMGFESVAVDASGTMYLLDRIGKDIIKFSAEGKFLNRIGAGLRSPNDIALDPEGNIYVSETSSIEIFNIEGRPIKSIDAYQAFGLAFNDSGEMLVAARPYVIKQRVWLTR